jgi:hypothetical protein
MLDSHLSNIVAVLLFVALELDGVFPEARIGTLVGGTSLGLSWDGFRSLLIREILGEGNGVVFFLLFPLAAFGPLLALLGGLGAIGGRSSPGISGRCCPCIRSGRSPLVGFLVGSLDVGGRISSAGLLGGELGVTFLGTPTRVNALFGVTISYLLVDTLGCDGSHSTCDRS